MRCRSRIVGLLICLSLVAPAVAARPDRNVVLMIGDDQGLELGCYGHPVIRTPSLDRLAATGTRFANAFATTASCSASRSVIMTGQFNHSTGHYGHAHGPHNFHTLNNVRSMPKILRNAGYRTGIVGKYHLKPAEVYPFEQLPCPGGSRNVTRMAESARNFIAADADAPFFLVVGYSDPHRARRGFANQPDYPGIEQITYKPAEVVVPPWLPDRPEVREELAQFYESISRLDQGIGQILDALDETGHADDTLVLYVSDNGPPWPGAKTTVYEPGIHLPMLIRSPGQKRHGVVCQAMASFVDLTPTILDWADVDIPKQVAGRSLLPILDEPDPPGWDTVFASHTFHEVTMYYPMRVIRTRQYKYILNLAHPLSYPFASDLWACPTWQAVVERGDETYGLRTVDAYLHRPREELYDLRSDPDEIHNLAADPAHAETLDDLRTRLRAWQQQTKDPWITKYEYE